MSISDKTTGIVRNRYNRIAPVYDLMESVIEIAGYNRWRGLLWSKVEGIIILEVGVGTGKNFPYYPAHAEITAIDFSERMLERARDKAEKQRIRVNLKQMDVQALEFDDDVFDTVVASFVFCSVPDPVRGFKEVMRVCKPEGKAVFMEHVISANRILGWLMNIANPFVVRIIGANINRQTVDNVAKSGLILEHVTDLNGSGIFKLVEARKKSSA
ncbi:MAG TPA: methyltransferase domain-containing protein [Dehalococcoidia bacterium]|nr:methyltransferase domain-containing protein [Dehalococcoidia bacterium]